MDIKNNTCNKKIKNKLVISAKKLPFVNSGLKQNLKFIIVLFYTVLLISCRNTKLFLPIQTIFILGPLI